MVSVVPFDIDSKTCTSEGAYVREASCKWGDTLEISFILHLSCSHRLEESLKRAAYSKRCTQEMRETSFYLPTQAVGRYVRVQLEGTNYLHFAECEVYGHWDEVTISKPVCTVLLL